MKPLRCFFRRLFAFTAARRNEERLRLEIEEHLAQQTAENTRNGMPPGEARRQAILKFGAIEATREACRDQRGIPFVEVLLRDISQAVRRLSLAPAFTVTIVLTLALGIGATTSIFTLAHAVLLKSLPVANPDQLYRLGKESRCCFYGGQFSQNKEFSLVSYDLYSHFRDNTPAFEQLAVFADSEQFFGVRRKGAPDAAQGYPGEYVSGNYFSMFGIRAWAGRMFWANDDQPGAPPVAVMSYRLWQEIYAADPSIVGSVFTLSDKPYTVIGVTPPGFYGDQLRDSPPDFYLPLHTADSSDLHQANEYWLDVIGRLRPGVNPAPVEATMRVQLKQWLRSHWSEMTPGDRATFPSQTLYLMPGGAGISAMRETYGHWLGILLAASGFVLLIVCANIASLMLVRGMERRRQTSLSMALGARSSRVVRQALTESVLLALCGGAAGLAIAFAGTRLILRFAFPPRAGFGAIPIDAVPSLPVLLFAIAVSLIAGIAFGVAPAWFASRVAPIEALRGAGRSTAGAGGFQRKALVVLQAALSLALLSAAGLLTTTLQRMQNQNLGFEQDRRLIVIADPALAGYRLEQLPPLYRRMHDALASVPGVSSVALCIYSPLEGNGWGSGIFVDGHPVPELGQDISANWDRVTGGYFEAIGNPIQRGRAISDGDNATSQHVAVINEAFARKFFPNEDPIGKHFGQYGPPAARQYEIVGIARDARYFQAGMEKPIGPVFFLPFDQYETFPAPGNPIAAPSSHFLRNAVVVLKPGASPPIAQLRQAMASVDPNIPVMSIRTLREQVSGNFTQPRLIARVTSLFGLLSLVLASLGLYGVTAFNVSRRTAEMGVRIAVGALNSDIVALVLRGALLLTVIGLLTGLPLALATGRFLGSQLYGMSPFDPAVLSAAVVVLALSALAASLIPALRATMISPLEALRAD